MYGVNSSKTRTGDRFLRGRRRKEEKEKGVTVSGSVDYRGYSLGTC